MTAGATAAVAAIADHKRNELYEAFRRRGATSAADATSLSELELESTPFLREALRSGAVVRAGEDRYYLNESVVRAHARASGAVILLALGIVAAFVLVRLITS